MLELLLIRNEIYSSETRLIGLTYDRLLADFGLATQMGVLQAYMPPARPAAPPGPPAVVTPLKSVSPAPSVPPSSP